MKNQIVASIAAIPFALGTVFAGTGAANAAALTGQFSFDGSDSNNTTLILSNEELDFNSDPDGAKIDLKLQTESFTAFNEAYIYDLLNPVSSATKFMDFGAQDGDNLLYATSLGEYQYSDLGSGVTGINIGFEGYFESDTGEISQAIGGITLQAIGSIEEVKEAVVDGNLEATFSGLSVSAKKVPEPTALFGLGIVAAGLSVTRRYGKKS